SPISRRSLSVERFVSWSASESSTDAVGGVSEKVLHLCSWPTGPSVWPKSTGTRRPVLAKRNSRSSAIFSERHMSSTRRNLLLCVRNDGYEASLERWKIYQALPDRDAAKHQQVRVVDESGEDYLYPATFFAAIKLPRLLRKAVLAAV